MGCQGLNSPGQNWRSRNSRAATCKIELVDCNVSGSRTGLCEIIHHAQAMVVEPTLRAALKLPHVRTSDSECTKASEGTARDGLRNAIHALESETGARKTSQTKRRSSRCGQS